MEDKYMIETKRLYKSFGSGNVVSDVNMHVKKGEIYGFVGPNGAGKSTVLKMLLNLIQPDAGEIILLGQKVYDDNYKIRKYIGSIIESPYFYDKISARENLELHCNYMGVNVDGKIIDVLKMVSLDGEENKTVSQYSLGMKQRLAIARAILTNPELLILDEPINALDPEGIVEMRNLFKALSLEHGMTILISSHILSEVEQIADTIGIIKSGRIMEERPLKDIERYQENYIEIVVDDSPKAAVLFTHSGIKFKQLDAEHIWVMDNHLSEIDLSAMLIKNDIGLISISRNKKSLEDYFFQAVSRDALKDENANGKS